MLLPRVVVMEHDAIYGTANVLQELKLDGEGLIVSGPNTYKFGKKIEDIIADKYAATTLTIGSATIEEVENVANQSTDKSFIIGVGGGKSIDTAKLASVKAKIPFISVPTAASHDGIASSRSSIHCKDKPHSIEAQTPLAVVLIRKLLLKPPKDFL